MAVRALLSFFVIVYGVISSAGSAATSFREKISQGLVIERYQLKNGLTVILHQDAKIPMVAYHQWFRVGSRHEKLSRTGLAHFFEHLMFKGSKNFSGPTYESFITGNGGYNNAFTTQDYTGYFTLIPSENLRTVIQMEADRMVNLKFDEKQIQSEREVVKEERRYRYDNDPDGTLYLMTLQALFKKGPYSWPVIGSMADLNATQLPEFREFYTTYYAPNNAVVVVAGAFSPSEVKRWIADAYGALPSQTLPPENLTHEVEPTAPALYRKTMEVQAPKMNLAFKTVPEGEADVYPLQILASLLGGGPSSRLYKLLVRERQLVTSVGGDAWSDKLEGAFTVSADLRPGQDFNRVRELIRQEIKKVQRTPPHEDEIAKVKNQVTLAYVRAMKTASGKARLLASSEISFGRPTQFFDDLDKIQAVSGADVARVARQYLATQRENTVLVEPKTQGSKR
jgi:zinc protease